MPNVQNPFEYDAANSLSDDEVLAYYVDDHNFARLIQSQHVQVFVREQIPERGAEYCKIIRESEDSALDRNDERG